MRGFLIRDILSAPTANAPAESSAGEQQASSSFDCASAQTLAQTQARFLAKLAEHQQHVQASKYYEQLQHQHQQLLNLNLNHHHLQLQQQLAQQQQQQQLHPAPGKQLSGALSAATGCSEGATASSKKQKTSSFAYDCASPISSISDVDRQEEEDDEDEDDDDEDRERDDEQDLDDEEIEVEKLVGEEPQGKGASARLSIRRQHRNREQDRRNHDTDDQDDHHRDLNPDGSSRMTMQQQQQQQQLLGKQLAAPFQLNSPLDALFQMTSSTFDALKRGEKRKGKSIRTYIARAAPLKQIDSPADVRAKMRFDGAEPLLSQVIIIKPSDVIAGLSVWWCHFQLERAIHQRAVHLRASRPIVPFIRVRCSFGYTHAHLCKLLLLIDNHHERRLLFCFALLCFVLTKLTLKHCERSFSWRQNIILNGQSGC